MLNKAFYDLYHSLLIGCSLKCETSWNKIISLQNQDDFQTYYSFVFGQKDNHPDEEFMQRTIWLKSKINIQQQLQSLIDLSQMSNFPSNVDKETEYQKVC
jgi:hypothetical protein